MKLTIVIPAHNEDAVIGKTIVAIEKQVTVDCEIVVVDDHSSDNTPGEVKALIEKFPNIRLVENDWERGFANALRKGFSVSNSQFVLPVMADLCDDPLTINEMHKKAIDGYDIVCGSRYMKGGTKLGGPPIQTFFSRFVGRSLSFIIGIPTSDVSNSFKLYRKKVLDSIKIGSKGFDISMEIPLKAYFAGYSITEVPTVWKGREIGKSKFYIFKVAPNYIKLYLWAVFCRKGTK